MVHFTHHYPQDPITRGWAAQRIESWGGRILCAEPAELQLEGLPVLGLATWGFNCTNTVQTVQSATELYLL